VRTQLQYAILKLTEDRILAGLCISYDVALVINQLDDAQTMIDSVACIAEKAV